MGENMHRESDKIIIRAESVGSGYDEINLAGFHPGFI